MITRVQCVHPVGTCPERLVHAVAQMPMDVDTQLTGVLYAETGVEGPDGYGFVDNSDPNWFVWRERVASATDKTVHRALFSPLITTWHLVAKAHPAGKYRYRGAYLREMAFSGSDQSPFHGMLLRRLPHQDLADPHLSLEEPLQFHLEHRVPISITPLGRAKHTLTELFNHSLGDQSLVWDMQWFLDAANVHVWDPATDRMATPPLFYHIIDDEVSPSPPPPPPPSSAPAPHHPSASASPAPDRAGTAGVGPGPPRPGPGPPHPATHRRSHHRGGARSLGRTAARARPPPRLLLRRRAPVTGVTYPRGPHVPGFT